MKGEGSRWADQSRGEIKETGTRPDGKQICVTKALGAGCHVSEAARHRAGARERVGQGRCIHCPGQLRIGVYTRAAQQQAGERLRSAQDFLQVPGTAPPADSGPHYPAGRPEAPLSNGPPANTTQPASVSSATPPGGMRPHSWPLRTEERRRAAKGSRALRREAPHNSLHLPLTLEQCHKPALNPLLPACLSLERPSTSTGLKARCPGWGDPVISSPGVAVSATEAPCPCKSRARKSQQLATAY